MKKIIALLLALLFLAGCASVAEPVGADANPPEVEITTETTTTTEWTMLPTQPMVLPTSFRGAPEVYWPVLQHLYMFVQGFRRNNMDYIEYAWNALEFDGNTVGNPGYMVADINGDGIYELILLGRFDDGDPFIIALYTIPIQLGSWTHRSSAVITTDGLIHYGRAGSASSGSSTIAKLEPGAAQLTELSYLWHDFRNGEHVVRTSAEGEWQVVSWEKLQDLWALRAPTDLMPLTFIPIEQ
ncbi:MAG: hypothetical protein FWE40_06785 [Oscillospiraceae bacterium]|nr:hypothetical protein [Oscillospiraceae bacterium]